MIGRFVKDEQLRRRSPENAGQSRPDELAATESSDDPVGGIGLEPEVCQSAPASELVGARVEHPKILHDRKVWIENIDALIEHREAGGPRDSARSRFDPGGDDV